MFFADSSIHARTPPVTSASSSMTPLEFGIWTVESQRHTGGPDCPKGDGGEALGPMQIHRCAWEDVQLPGEFYEDCAELDYSVVVFGRYMDRYATSRRLGYPPRDEDRARIWNGGPNGFKEEATVVYWNKVKAVLEP